MFVGTSAFSFSYEIPPDIVWSIVCVALRLDNSMYITL
jgi:hypothetical protein